jgi:RNA polymerase sigma factor (TIGR02999 family)
MSAADMLATILMAREKHGETEPWLLEVYDQGASEGWSASAACRDLAGRLATVYNHLGHVDWKSRAHFFAFAARTMRRILVDYARKRHAARRGGDKEAITLDTQVAGADGVRSIEILALDAALDRLARLDARQSKMVELRFFAGLTVRETAEALGISEITVQRDWSSARAWLVSRLAT